MNFGNWQVKTSFDYPPIPLRSVDWSAWCDGLEDWKVGRGQTELEALLDLHEQLVETGTLPELTRLSKDREQVRREVLLECQKAIEHGMVAEWCGSQLAAELRRLADSGGSGK